MLAKDDMVRVCSVDDLRKSSRLNILRTFMFRSCGCKASHCAICSQRCHLTLSDGHEIWCPAIATDGFVYDAFSLQAWLQTSTAAVSAIKTIALGDDILAPPRSIVRFISAVSKKSETARPELPVRSCDDATRHNAPAVDSEVRYLPKTLHKDITKYTKT